MRKSAKALVLVLVALVGSVGLTIGAAFSASFAFGAAVALIVPGTGTHNVLDIPEYRGNAALRYIDPVSGSPQFCTNSNPADCTTTGVPYPATFFPLVIFSGWCPGLSCDTWNKSVGTGVTNLNDEVHDQIQADPNQQIVIFGYSQGGAVVSQEMYKLLADTTVDKSKISVVTIGNINNPLGLWSRLSFLPTIPFLDISFGPQLPTEGIKSTNYSFEYDPVGDAPQYWGNPVAMLNALAAFEYVHGYYLSPNENGTTDTLPYGYNNDTLAYAIAHTATVDQYNDATFVLIPQQGALPIYQPFVDLANTTGTRALIDPVISLIQPVTKVFINLGYDRTTNPGIARTLSILPADPFQNWFKVGEDVAGGVVEGVTNVVNGVDVTKPSPTPPADSSIVAGSSNVTDLVSKKTPTVVDKDTAAADVIPIAKVKDNPAKTTVTKLKDVTKNRPVATAIKKAADRVGAQVKASVDKVKAAVTKAIAPKEKKKDATEAKAKDAA
jgi:hypothetical protein